MEYLFTERAHLMCPGMHFGIAIAVGKRFDRPLIEAAVEKLAGTHPFLRALLGYEKEKAAYFYAVTDSSKAGLFFQEEEIGDCSSSAVLTAYRQLTSRDWNLYTEGMLKIAAWRSGAKTVFLLVFHHLLADGRGALGLAEELADLYVQGIEPKPVSEKLITRGDLPNGSGLSFISRSLVNSANRNWKKEQHRLSYEAYHALADAFVRGDAVTQTLQTVPSAELAALHTRCRDAGVSINDYLLAQMFIEDGAKSIIIACDLRNRLSCYAQGALGNYSTAFSVKVRKRGRDVFTLARQVHRLVQKKLSNPRELFLVLQCYAALEPGLLDAAFASCRGNFESRAGKFIGSLFFGFAAAKGYSITNLGKIESQSIESAYFIPPASPAIRKTQGVLTVNGTMAVCTVERSMKQSGERPQGQTKNRQNAAI